ncbi:bifunctional 4-hydroxy-2-oxoglutarate aldolase/2-dehydro-3-deoxy-phosphogluconate aldolase [Arthrobacter sp. A2-55]|uniref:bifunctional 4-hydroxy-2-oxoglutarate aldolase/2-dehydro-3-deoxy-phosphogluconate aldolase n=1 Tax=Arthrobacter sp. A2-55 TaxID=2897337 RepID=UPI0021CDB60E|nr:bifunctional 4-hydroxy-2-oxoglutarate aldolase/2-dehydro-3-deoxy-phosphogluconate aldolase [Arthrobacter sp. A2-55]MCU6482466.1 bifunctional 4-hydroxy-2-oxoglutarate aldolase/2-dehydro-3-deoxy-phosphogluconate aldolase [Arthrobacter sp. A2-55]
MPTNHEFTELFTGQPLMAILRGMGEEKSLALAEQAWSLGIGLVEIPVQTEEDLRALRAVAAAGKSRGLLVGAGTVVSLKHVEQSAEAGAAFTVSPGLDLAVVAASTEAGMPTLPGVATASEVQLALSAGLTWMKAFPASLLGAGWFKAMSGPFPQARFVATGGMDSANAATFLAGGASVVAVGSALEDPAQLPALAKIMQR